MKFLLLNNKLTYTLNPNLDLCLLMEVIISTELKVHRHAKILETVSGLMDGVNHTLKTVEGLINQVKASMKSPVLSQDVVREF